jgi:ubiquinone/menaquinone biosynthesis C-methylase UbiE
MLNAFVKWNRKISYSVVPRVFRDTNGSDCFYEWVRALIRSNKPKTVLDVGAGRRFCVEDIRTECKFKLIGQDVDAGELALNPALDDRKVCDASETLGVTDGSIDLVISHFAIEHIPNNSGFIAASHRALSPGGHLAVVFQGKWAPSSLLNRMLPEGWSQKLVHTLVPGSNDYLGFKTHYDKCSHSEFRKALTQQGYIIEREHNSYFNSGYFAFFLPLFVVALGLDYLRMWLNARDLATQCVFVARKGT